jgi:hypothetical protein
MSGPAQSRDEFLAQVLEAAGAQIERHPPDRATDCRVRLEGTDLVFECSVPEFAGDRIAYRIEAWPEDEADRGSSAGWAGVAVRERRGRLDGPATCDDRV